MIVNREIQTFKLLPITISELAEKLNIYPGSASKIIEKLIKNGLAKKQREGKHVLIVKERTTHSQKLEEIIRTFSRLPLEKILTHSHLTIIALLNYQLKPAEIEHITNISRQWIYKIIDQLSRYGIILKKPNGYIINPIHRILQEFAKYYYEYINYQYISKLSDDAVLIWQHGNEILFKTKKEIKNLPTTAVTIFSNYDLPLISETKYYYQTNRTLNTSDTILHTILINPNNKTYNTYACLLIEKTNPTDLKKKARLYNLTSHLQQLILFLKHKEKQEKFLPSWTDYESLAKQYGVR